MTPMTANAPYKMIGVRPVAGRCAHCGRECPERVFVVEDRQTGEQVTLGAHCSWKATGQRDAGLVEAPEVDEPIGEIPAWMFGEDAA